MNGKPIDVEAFTDRAATSLYKSYSKGIFDGHSSFKIPLHYYLANEDINETLSAFEAIREKLVNGTYAKIAEASVQNVE